jgi:hemerythrin superfamily protein
MKTKNQDKRFATLLVQRREALRARLVAEQRLQEAMKSLPEFAVLEDAKTHFDRMQGFVLTEFGKVRMTAADHDRIQALADEMYQDRRAAEIEELAERSRA